MIIPNGRKLLASPNEASFRHRVFGFVVQKYKFERWFGNLSGVSFVNNIRGILEVFYFLTK